MKDNISNLLNWINPLLKQDLSYLFNLCVSLKTQNNVLNNITVIVSFLKGRNSIVSKELKLISANLFYNFKNINYHTYHQQQFYPTYNHYIPSPAIIENVIRINIFALGRLYQLLNLLSVESTFDTKWELIHEEIIEVSKKKFMDGNYSDAVKAAFIHINTKIKKIYRVFKPEDTHTDGTSLMENVFSKHNPKIIIADQSTQTGRDIHEGYANIFKGSMLAIRNQTAHENIEMSKEMAFEKLALASLLIYRLEKAQINKDND